MLGCTLAADGIQHYKSQQRGRVKRGVKMGLTDRLRKKWIDNRHESYSNSPGLNVSIPKIRCLVETMQFSKSDILHSESIFYVRTKLNLSENDYLVSICE